MAIQVIKLLSNMWKMSETGNIWPNGAGCLEVLLYLIQK